jgi:hypothetical protein
LRHLPQLSETDKITVLRKAVNHRAAFGAPGQTDKKFWERIAKEVSDESIPKRPPHQTLGRSIKALVNSRLRELELDESGTQEGRDELTIALDAWLEVIQSRRHREDARDNQQFVRDDEARDTEVFRRDQLNLYDRKSFRQGEGSQEQSEDNEGNEEQDQQLSSTPVSRGRSRSRGGRTGSRQSQKRRAVALVDEEEDREREIAVDEALLDIARTIQGRSEGGGVSLERLEAVESKLGGLEQNVSEMLRLLKAQEQREEARKRRRKDKDEDLL